VQEARKALKDLAEVGLRDHKVLLVLQVRLDHKVLREPSDHKVLLVLQVLQVQMALLALLALQVQME
jgi:hypothetical protein